MRLWYLLHIHPSVYQRSSPSQRCPSSCLCATSKQPLQLFLVEHDMPAKLTSSPDHCDARVQIGGGGEPVPGLTPVLLAFHHNGLTWTTLLPFVRRDRE